MKKVFTMLLALALLFGCAAAEGGEVTCTVASVAADGTAALDTTVEALEAQGFALGDVVSVIAGGIVCTMPTRKPMIHPKSVPTSASHMLTPAPFRKEGPYC